MVKVRVGVEHPRSYQRRQIKPIIGPVVVPPRLRTAMTPVSLRGQSNYMSVPLKLAKLAIFASLRIKEEKNAKLLKNYE